MNTSSRHRVGGSSSFIRRLFSTGSIFLNADSREELLNDIQSASIHDPGDGGRYAGFVSYSSPLGGFVGYGRGHGFGDVGFGSIGLGGPGHFGGGPGPGGFGGPGFGGFGGPGPGGFGGFGPGGFGGPGF